MAGVSSERVELFLEERTCKAHLYLGDKLVIEITAARGGGTPWASGTEGVFAALIIVAERLRIESERLGIPVRSFPTPEAKA